ncbi:class I SAM-dependent methyltransferase [Cryptosporangium sp. NPDC051539]|uniref:class I SAM-dependent methyltransferase n=1 Tax=Cryptosporangium sp. NPDC051539 TaxID=3363962 RepID=UPI003794AF3E
MSSPITPPLTARANLRWAVVRPTLERLAPTSILELGCGQGAVGARLAQYATYTGVEPDESSWQTASSRISGTVLHGDHHKVPEGAEYGLVCAFEVLEHIADDRGTLAEWVQFIQPGGKLMVSVPADQHRFGPSDELVGHYRRYSADDLEALLTSVGCTDVAIRRYGWPVGYALEAVSNRVSAKKLAEPAAPVSEVIEERGATSGRFLQPKKAAGQVLKLGMAPFTLIQELAPSKGIGLLAVATGPKG